MIEQSGSDYASSKYLKMLAVSGAKEGKTSFLTASILGALPWQKFGGLVSKPENLHVVTFDANALGGVRDFITKSCGKPESYLAMRVYNLQDDVRALHAGGSEWDFTLFNTMQTVADKIRATVQRTGGVHAVLVSSLTGLARGIQRGIAGPPSEKKKGSGMDASKWQSLDGQLSELQNIFQSDTHHMFWEAHIDKPPDFMKKDGDEAPKETIQVTGKAGRWWAFNTEQVVRLRREHGNRVGAIDKVHMDTRPSADFLSGGRSFTEKLNAKEYDLTELALKLGLLAGRFGFVKKEAAAK